MANIGSFGSTSRRDAFDAATSDATSTLPRTITVIDRATLVAPEYAMYSKGTGSVVMARDRESAATPTTSRPTVSRAPNATRLPIGSSFGQNFFAAVWLTMSAALGSLHVMS